MTTKIALFDRSPHLRRLFQTMLVTHDYLLYTFDEQNELLAALEHLHPELIMLGDIGTAEDDDFQFFTRLKAITAISQVPIIMAMDVPPNLFQNPLLDQQAKVWLLPKPFTSERLLDGLKVAVQEGRRARAAAKAKAQQDIFMTLRLKAQTEGSIVRLF